MRSAKTEAAAFRASGDKEAFDRASLKVKERMATLDGFISDNNLAKRVDRTQVYGYNKSVAGSAAQSAKRQASIIKPLSQEKPSVGVPKNLIGNYDDFESLSLEPHEKAALISLNSLTKKTGNEYGVLIRNGKASEPFTDGNKTSVAIDMTNLKKGTTILHSHSNVTPLSGEDFAFLVDERIDKIGNIAYNGDVFIASIGSGWRPTVSEYRQALGEIAASVDAEIQLNPEFGEWTTEEKNYMAIREQAFQIARMFKWKMEGGSING